MEQVYLYLYLVKSHWLVEIMQAMVHNIHKAFIYTHSGIGWSNSPKYLSAEWSKVKWMPVPTIKKFPKGVEIYKVPISEDKYKEMQEMMDKYNNMPYDKYFYGLWVLKIMPVFIPIMYLITSFISLIAVGILTVILFVLYSPVSNWLHDKSEKAWACSMFTSMALEEVGKINFNVGKRWSSITPHILRMLVRFNKWERVDEN